ncbi:recombinase RecT [Nocardia aurea]|uniref:recombinase RecT n=1 Tax=Nocardia aurea TaxID=2144174 RepID=UPI000D69A294|nr:recombinase RecT [Nocardia aurea]
MSAPQSPPPLSPLAIAPEQERFTDTQISALALISRWTTTPPTAALNLFFHSAVTCNLDPFREQIRLLLRREPVVNARGTEFEERWSVETSIHGFRILGARAAQKRGVILETSPPLFYDDRSRTWDAAWPHATDPVAAHYTITAIHPDNRRETVDGIVHFDEFAKFTQSGAPTRGWARMPRHMLAKCAEADAWRRLFPDELGWLSLADSADITNEHTSTNPSDSAPAAQQAPSRSVTHLLGKPSTPTDRAVPTDTTAEPADTARNEQPVISEPGASGVPAPEAKSAQATTSARRPPRPTATRRRTPAAADHDAIEAFVVDAAAALRRDAAGVLVWATEQLGRQIGHLDELTAQELETLRSNLPTDISGDNTKP